MKEHKRVLSFVFVQVSCTHKSKKYDTVYLIARRTAFTKSGLRLSCVPMFSSNSA